MEAQPKEEFVEIFQKQITREGSERLLNWLSGTDFFTVPRRAALSGIA